MLDLPGGASDAHLELFSAMVADNVTANRIAPEMKYRYLSSAVQITGRRPTVYPAEQKIKFYDSLLKEIRLQTRLDGSDRIHAPGTFGVFVSLVHTADAARESGGFGKYGAFQKYCNTQHFEIRGGSRALRHHTCCRSFGTGHT